MDGVAGAYRKTRYPNVYWRGDALYVAFRDEHRRKREQRYGEGTPAQAAEFQRRLQREANAVRAGETTRAELTAKRESTRPIDAVIGRYGAHLTALGRSAPHVKDTARMLRAWAEGTGTKTIAQADPDRLGVFLESLEAKGRSPRTVNAYRMAVLALCNWAQDFGLVSRRPISARLVRRRDEKRGRVRLSRAMAPAQVRALLTCARVSRRRRLFYAVCVLTGLRWREAERLAWADVDLPGGVIAMPEDKTKNRKAATVPIPAALRAMLEEEKRSQRPDGRVCGVAPNHLMWKRDLRRAGVIGDGEDRDAGYEDARGRRLDRKCLRMTFSMLVRRSGADPRDQRDLLRHGSFDLLMQNYNDLRVEALGEVAEAVASTIFQPETAPDNSQYPNNAKPGEGEGPRMAAG